jgi:hypothetical protein
MRIVMELASLLIGLGSFLVSVLPLTWQAIGQLRGQSKYKTLQASFDDVYERLWTLRKSKDPWERVLSLLEIGDVLMPQVRARFWRRLTLLLAIGLGSGAAAATAAQAIQSHRVVLLVSLLLVGANWAAAFSKLANKHLLTLEEQLFFKNVGLLQDRFYQHCVVDSVFHFNQHCSDLLAEDSKTAAEEWAALRAEFEGSLSATTNKQIKGST